MIKKPAKMMRRTTVDLPLLIEQQLRRAAWNEAQTKDKPMRGMLGRYITEAVTAKLTLEGWWPPKAEDLVRIREAKAHVEFVPATRLAPYIGHETREQMNTRMRASENKVLKEEGRWPHGVQGEMKKLKRLLETLGLAANSPEAIAHCAHIAATEEDWPKLRAAELLMEEWEQTPPRQAEQEVEDPEFAEVEPPAQEAQAQDEYPGDDII